MKKIIELLNSNGNVTETLVSSFGKQLETNVYDKFIRNAESKISSIEMEILSLQQKISLSTDLNKGRQAMTFTEVELITMEIIEKEVLLRKLRYELKNYVRPSLNEYFAEPKEKKE